MYSDIPEKMIKLYYSILKEISHILISNPRLEYGNKIFLSVHDSITIRHHSASCYIQYTLEDNIAYTNFVQVIACLLEDFIDKSYEFCTELVHKYYIDFKEFPGLHQLIIKNYDKLISDEIHKSEGLIQKLNELKPKTE